MIYMDEASCENTYLCLFLLERWTPRRQSTSQNSDNGPIGPESHAHTTCNVL